VPLLDGRKVLLAVDQIVTPKTVKKIEGEGMPTYEPRDIHDTRASERGNLYVSFEVVFPKQMSQPQREAINELLS